MKRYSPLLKLPLRTRNILKEAKELEKHEFFSVAILQYSIYLEHFLILSKLSYYENRDPEYVNVLRKQIFEAKRNKALTFNSILKKMPNKIMDKEIRSMCNKVRNIRNEIAAHSYFLIPLDKTHSRRRNFDDVNLYRKFIRDLYKLIRKETQIKEVNSFLEIGHPITVYSHIEELAERVEYVLMKSICKNISSTIPIITEKIYDKLYANTCESNLHKFFTSDRIQ